MKSKVALITGATSGIGQATALAFAKAGAKVALSGRREKEGQEVVAQLKGQGAEALFITGDVSKEKDCQRMVDETLKHFGRLDCAFNNAGVEGRMGPITEESVDNFEQVMNINVLGVLLCMKYQIPAMRKSGGGAIVNNASIAGIIGMAGASTYVASKHAVVGLSRAAALEVAKENIRINIVSPAAIETDMYSRFTNNDANTREYLKNLHPIGRVGRSDEIANAVLFLCSEQASFITGTNLAVDGGFTAQ